MKKKVLFCTESGDLSTGYGNYTKSILTRLYNTNKYDIAELSCYKTVDTKNKFPWKVYPNAVSVDDERYQKYNSVLQNQFGQWRFDLVVGHFKPDIVIDFRDVFMSLYQRTSVFRNHFHWIIAPTIDSFPVRPEWLDSLSSCDTLLTHTHWAKNEIQNRYNINVSGVVKDSIDTDVFKPINKIGARNKLGIANPNAFIIGSVMRNQKRKLIPELMRILSEVLKEYPDTYLYLHTSYPETKGWNIPQLLMEFDVFHRVIFTYICKNCGHVAPMTWKGEVYQCQKCRQRKLVLPSSSRGVSEETLAMIYNTFDIYIQYAICEGFGIPPLEAASCGIPLITVNHGAMKELGEDLNANLVDIGEWYRDGDNSSDRVHPDNNSCINEIKNMINTDMIEMINIKEQYRNKVLQKYSWDFTAKEFEKIIDSIDISNSKGWKPIPIKHFDNINKNSVADGTNRELIYNVVDKVLEEPELKNSFFVQSLIKALDNGYLLDDDKIIPYKKEDAIKVLEMWFNNKTFLHRFLEDNKILPNRDFLKY